MSWDNKLHSFRVKKYLPSLLGTKVQRKGKYFAFMQPLMGDRHFIVGLLVSNRTKYYEQRNNGDYMYKILIAMVVPGGRVIEYFRNKNAMEAYILLCIIL